MLYHDFGNKDSYTQKCATILDPGFLQEIHGLHMREQSERILWFFSVKMCF